MGYCSLIPWFQLLGIGTQILVLIFLFSTWKLMMLIHMVPWVVNACSCWWPIDDPRKLQRVPCLDIPFIPQYQSHFYFSFCFLLFLSFLLLNCYFSILSYFLSLLYWSIYICFVFALLYRGMAHRVEFRRGVGFFTAIYAHAFESVSNQRICRQWSYPG